METRDLLLLIGFLRSGRMFPTAVPLKALPAQRSIRILIDGIAEQERALFGAADTAVAPAPSGPSSAPPSSGSGGEGDDLRARAAVTSWSGDFLPWNARIGELPDPGVLLCLLYDGPAADAALPIDVFAQTLRRFALRDQALRAKFEEHVDRAGTFVPPWLSPEVRRQKSQQAFDSAMKVAREQGFAHAAPLFEGVRGDCFAPAQIAVAVYELRELGDVESARGRLDEVVRVAPRNVAARMQRAQLLGQDALRRLDASVDYLAVLRELARPDTVDGSPQLRDAATRGLWALHREFEDRQALAAARALVTQDPERGFEALSRYVHTHPCAWDAQILLASLALARQTFDLTIKLLANLRWLFPADPNPHFVYGQALASRGNTEAAIAALEVAASIAPGDADVQEWLAFTRSKLADEREAELRTPSVTMVHHIARTMLLLVGFVREGRVQPAAIVLHRVPGDVSLAFVVQALAGQEQRRFGDGGPAKVPLNSSEIDMGGTNDRAVLLSFAGGRLTVDQTVGDVPDPGVMVAFLYDAVTRDAAGRPTYAPDPAECRQTLDAIARTDTEIVAKLERHLASPDATLMARLDRG
jgi:hypothetical protein